MSKIFATWIARGLETPNHWLVKLLNFEWDVGDMIFEICEDGDWYGRVAVKQL